MNKRRPTISRILAVTCALSIFAGAFASAPSKPATFSDVQPGDWFYPYVTEMAELDAVSGFTDGTFRPGAPVSRLEAYTMALGMFPREGYTAEDLAKVDAVNGPDFGATGPLPSPSMTGWTCSASVPGSGANPQLGMSWPVCWGWPMPGT